MTPTVCPPQPQLPPQQIWLLLPRFQNYSSPPAPCLVPADFLPSPSSLLGSKPRTGPRPSIHLPLATCQLVHTPLFLEPGLGCHPPTGAQSAWMEGHHHCSWVSLISAIQGPFKLPPGFMAWIHLRAQGCSEVDRPAAQKAPRRWSGVGACPPRESFPFTYISPVPPATSC